MVRLPLDAPYHLPATLGGLAGGFDPTARAEAGALSKAWWSPGGPVTARFCLMNDTLQVEAWGAGADWALAHVADLAGLWDDRAGFDPGLHPVVAELDRRFRGARLPRRWGVWTLLLPVVLGQLVTFPEQRRAWTNLVRSKGEAAPGPLGLLLPPTPDRVFETPTYAMTPMGILGRQAETLREVARVAARLEEAQDLPLERATARLQAVRGIGPWSAMSVALRGLGFADAVPTGDYHLPSTVAFALAGEPRADDARMLALLAPWAGHRGRVVRLLMGGEVGPPRRGPRREARPLPRA